MNKFLIYGIWPDFNKGDSAISLGNVEIIKNLNNKANIKFVSTYSDKEQINLNNLYFKDTYPEIDIIPGINSNLQKKTKTFRIAKISWQMFLLLLPRFFYRLYPKNLKNLVQEILNTDMVIHTGGHFYFTFNKTKLNRFIKLYNSCYVILWAHKLNKPYIIMSQSIGPFNGKNIAGALSRFVLQNAEYILTREKISIKNVNQLVKSKKEVNQILDLAFYLNISEFHKSQAINILKKYDLLNKKIIALTVRKSASIGTNLSESTVNEYLENMKKIIDIHKKNNSNYYYVFFPQTYNNKMASENDVALSRRIKNSLFDKERVVVIDEIVQTQAIYHMYSYSHLLIATRLHSCIFALSHGVPCISLYSHLMGPKTLGVSELFDIQRYSHEIENMNIQKIIKQMNYILDNREKNKQEILNRLHYLKNKTNNITKRIFNLQS